MKTATHLIVRETFKSADEDARNKTLKNKLAKLIKSYVNVQK